METGIVERINVWQKGTGFYFVTGGKKYYSYGQPLLQVGDEIKYLLTGRKDKEGHPEAKIASYPPEIQTPYKPVPHDDKPIVTRLSCISSAVEFCKGKDRLPEDVVAVAKKFEKFAKEG